MKPIEDKRLEELIAVNRSVLEGIRDKVVDALKELDYFDLDAMCYDDMTVENWRLDGCHSRLIIAFEEIEPAATALFNHIKDARERELFGMTAIEALDQQAAKSA